jgi:hypothetical protein
VRKQIKVWKTLSRGVGKKRAAQRRRFAAATCCAGIIAEFSGISSSKYFPILAQFKQRLRQIPDAATLATLF